METKPDPVIEHPADVILRQAREGAYDVIVTGTRSRGPVARFLLGLMRQGERFGVRLELSHANGQPALLALLSAEGLALEFSLAGEVSAVRRLVARYRDRPMSLADACLVRMSELLSDSSVITIDEDFHVYRRHGRQVIPLISPATR